MHRPTPRPLQGLRILVTRPRGQSRSLADGLAALGAEPICIAAIETAPPDDWAALDAALRDIASFDWVVFTSVNGARAFVERVAALGLPRAIHLPPSTSPPRIAAIGPATGRALAALWRAPDAMPEKYLSDRVAAAMGDVSGCRVLLARADIARRELPQTLAAMGAEVVEVDAYRVVGAADPRELAALAHGPEGVLPDYITLTSPSVVRSVTASLAEAGLGDWMERSRLACIGPVTAEAVAAMGLKPACVAETHTAEGLIEAISGDWCSRFP